MALPRIYAGRRRQLLWRLIANGGAQALLAFAIAHLLRSGLRHVGTSTLDLRVVAAMGASGLLLLGLRTVEAADAERLGQEYVMDVRVRIFDRIAAGPARARGRRRWGVTMTRMISDLNALRGWVSTGIARSAVASITIVGLLIALASFDAHATAAAVIVGVLCGALVLALTPRLRAYVLEARRRRGRLANNLGEKLFAAWTVSQLGRARPERRRVRSHSRQLQEALVRRVRIRQILRGLPRAALPLTLCGWIAIAAARGASTGHAAVSVLLLGMIASSLGDLARGWESWLNFEVGRRRIDELLAGPRVRESRHAVALPGSGPLRIVFHGVRPTRRDDPIDLDAAPGEVVLVVGPTGSGKSTLLALASRLLDPADGEIRLDDVPLRELKLDSLRRAVQLVAPEIPLLRGSLIGNIGYGAGDSADEWMEAVVRACGLREPSDPLPLGLDSRIEEQGANLPHGLRARVALARAAAMRPRLLLIDDTAFSLDPAAATALARVVELLGSTTLVVGQEAQPPIPPDRVWRLAPRSCGTGLGEAGLGRPA